jgi:hypothetical protein
VSFDASIVGGGSGERERVESVFLLSIQESFLKTLVSFRFDHRVFTD